MRSGPKRDAEGNPVRHDISAMKWIRHGTWMTLLAYTASAPAQGVIDSLKKAIGLAPPHPVIRAGYKAEDFSPWGRAVGWLDNDRVIFFGHKADLHKEKGIWIWDVSRNTVTLHARVSASAGFCYARGYVRYMVNDPTPAWKDGRLTAPQVWRIGAFGKEQEWHTPEAEMTTQGAEQARRDRYLSRFTCREYPNLQKKYREKFGIADFVFPLLEGHGVLDLFPTGQSDTRTVRWFGDEMSAPLDIGLPRCAVRAHSTQFIEHLGAYLLYGAAMPPKCSLFGNRWPAGSHRPMVLLFPKERRIERRDFPASDWNYGSALTALTAAGFVVSRSENRDSDGVYLMRERREILIAKGKGGATDMAVAPNGCRLAVNTPQFGSSGMQMIDLCNRGK